LLHYIDFVLYSSRAQMQAFYSGIQWMRREYIFVFAGNEYAHRAFDEYCREKRVSALFFFGEWCGSR
jgi:hypothetical protein